MTRSSLTSPRPTRRRRSVSPPRRAARGLGFTRLGFAFYSLVSINEREPGEPPFVALRMRVARTRMAAFVAASPMNANAR
jgi:hypothetical protein